jgi:DNA gyrase/topoisomerase IV subunit A
MQPPIAHLHFADVVLNADDRVVSREHHTDTTVDFTVTMTEAGLQAVTERGLVNFFKLQTKTSTSNMMLFDVNRQIMKYNSPEHIIQDFFTLRLQYYEKRRIHLLAVAQNQLMRISNKACTDDHLCSPIILWDDGVPEGYRVYEPMQTE